MFIVLQEPTNEIWRRKVEWIANAGGMVLLNVHPDYLNFKTGSKAARVQVREHYRALLTWLKTTYRDSFWHPLPSEMAAFVRPIAPNLTYTR